MSKPLKTLPVSTPDPKGVFGQGGKAGRDLRAREIEVASQLIGSTPAVRVVLASLLVLLTTTAEAAVPGVPTSVAVYSTTSQKLEVRWSSSDFAVTTGFKIQWKSGTQEYDSLRQDEADPATSLVSASSSETSRRYRHIITGLTNGTERTVRVIATNAEGNSNPSSEATGTPDEDPGQVEAFVENEVVAIHGSFFPWLRDALSYLVTQNVPMMFRKDRFGHVFRNCPPSLGLLPTCSIASVELGRHKTNRSNYP